MVGTAITVVVMLIAMNTISQQQEAKNLSDAATLAAEEIRSLSLAIKSRFNKRSPSVTPAFVTLPYDLTSGTAGAAVVGSLTNGVYLRAPRLTNPSKIQRATFRTACQASPAGLADLDYTSIPLCIDTRHCPAGQRPVVYEVTHKDETSTTSTSKLYPLSYQTTAGRTATAKGAAVAMVLCAIRDAAGSELRIDLTAYYRTPGGAAPFAPHAQRLLLTDDM